MEQKLKIQKPIPRKRKRNMLLIKTITNHIDKRDASTDESEIETNTNDNDDNDDHYYDKTIKKKKIYKKSKASHQQPKKKKTVE